MGLENKEHEMVIEALSGISYRNRIFAEALEDGDIKTMLAAFMMEQHNHYLSIADSVNDPDLKLLLLDYSTTMGVEVKKAVELLLDSR